MKINALTATFGKFNNESIAFHSGLNVIYAPNESGKSTWCEFIMAMLYGVDSSERSKAGSHPVKQRYAPWSGASMEGTAELTADRCDITITRTTRLKNAPMQEFSAVYTGTNVPVEGMTGKNAGELLAGVSREVFARSAYVGQGSAALTGSPEMEKRIQTILSTGEEDATFSEADEQLAAWQRKRKYHQRGLLPELEGEIRQLAKTIDEADRSAADIREAEGKLAELQTECSELETEVILERKQRRKRVLAEITEAREEARRLTEEQNCALEELHDKRNDLRRSLFGRRSAEDVEAEAERDMERLDQLSTLGRAGKMWIPAILFFLLALIGAVVYDQLIREVYVIVIAAVLCLTALVFFVLFVSQRSAVNDARKETLRILRKYRAANRDEITLRLDEHHARCVAAQRAEEKAGSAAEAADLACERLEELERRAADHLDMISGTSKEAMLMRTLAEKRKKAANLSSQIASEKGKLAVIGDPVVMKSEQNRLEEKRTQIEAEFHAIEMARSVLREADAEIQSRYTPELGKIAAEYMSFVTGGRYESIMLNKDFSALAKTKDEAVARESEYLSTGTVDLLYLAVRLAVCEFALPAGEPCPLIIDDALVNMDELRYQQAMKLLREIAKERQVILFTCRKGEKTENAEDSSE